MNIKTSLLLSCICAVAFANNTHAMDAQKHVLRLTEENVRTAINKCYAHSTLDKVHAKLVPLINKQLANEKFFEQKEQMKETIELLDLVNIFTAERHFVLDALDEFNHGNDATADEN